MGFLIKFVSFKFGESEIFSELELELFLLFCVGFDDTDNFSGFVFLSFGDSGLELELSLRVSAMSVVSLGSRSCIVFTVRLDCVRRGFPGLELRLAGGTAISSEDVDPAKKHMERLYYYF